MTETLKLVGEQGIGITGIYSPLYPNVVGYVVRDLIHCVDISKHVTFDGALAGAVAAASERVGGFACGACWESVTFVSGRWVGASNGTYCPDGLECRVHESCPDTCKSCSHTPMVDAF